MVRPGASEAVVEGRFVVGTSEVVLRRVVPAKGRSRAYVDGRLATVAELAELGARARRPARPARPPVAARARGAARRARPLRRHRPRPLREARDGAAPDRGRARPAGRRRAGAGPRDRPAALPGRRARRGRPRRPRRGRPARRRGGPSGRRGRPPRGRGGRRGGAAGDGGAADAIGRAIAALDGRDAFAVRRGPPARARRRARRPGRRAADVRRERSRTTPSASPRSADAVSCCAICAASTATTWPRSSRARRRGQRRWPSSRPTTRLAAALEAERVAARAEVEAQERVVAAARRAAAPQLAAAVEAHLPELALPKARLDVEVGPATPGDDVAFLLAANPGSPSLPLAKVASGGELARAMLALRLVLIGGPAHARLRRGRRRHRRRRGAGGRSALAALGGRPSGARRHPPAPGGGVRRRPGHGRQARRGRPDRAPQVGRVDRRGTRHRAGADAVGVAGLGDRHATTPESCWPSARSGDACSDRSASPTVARGVSLRTRRAHGRREGLDDEAHLRDRRCGQLARARGSPPRRSGGCSRRGACGSRCRSSTRTSTSIPGTMNPFEHGEVFVTDDGGETDLDLGHYERFIDENLSPRLQRHHRLDLLGGARRRAPGRLPGQDRAGDPPHHRRDQAPHHPPGRRRRRRRHHRGRRHRRRHRDPPVPRGHPAVPPRRRPRQRLLRARHPGAVHRPVGRAEDQAHPALGHRAAQPGHPARRHRVPQRAADLADAQAQDLQPLRRARRRAWSTPPTPATSTRSRSSCTTRASTPWSCELLGLDDRDIDLSEWEILVDRVEAAEHAGAHRHHRQVREPARRLPVGGRGRSSTAASTTAPRSRSTGSRPRRSRGCWPTGRLRDLDGIVIPGGFGERGIEGKIAAAGYAREHDIPCLGPVPRHAGDDHRVRPQRARASPAPTRASSTRQTPHPVIDLMDDPARRHRHGRHHAPRRLRRRAAARVAGGRGLRRDGRLRAPPPPLRVQPPLPQPASRAPGFVCSGTLARRSPGRVHRARRATRSGSAPRPIPSSRAGPTGPPRCSASSSAPRSAGPRAATRTCSTSTTRRAVAESAP